MKPITFVPLMAFLLALTGCDGCNKKPTMGPQESLRAFLEANVRGDSKSAYRLLSAADQRRRGAPSEVGLPSQNDPVSEAIFSRIRFEIEELRVEKDGVELMVTTHIPDREALASLMADVSFDRSLSGGQPESSESLMVAKIKADDFPMTRRVESFHMVREGGEWRIRLEEEN